MDPALQRHRRAATRGVTGLAFLVALLVLSGQPAAQDVTEPALKAAFLYNFARFTDWPDDVVRTRTRLVACVIGDTPVAGALERAVSGRQAGGRGIVVVRLGPSATFETCALLYIAGVDAETAARIAGGLHGSPILTVVDIDGREVRGGIARLFVDRGKMRLEFDLGLAIRCRLQLSSKLLALASKVIGQPGVSQ